MSDPKNLLPRGLKFQGAMKNKGDDDTNSLKQMDDDSQMSSRMNNHKEDEFNKSMINGIRKKYNSNIFNKGTTKKECKTEGRRRFTTMHPSLLNPSVIDQNEMQ